MTADTLSEIYSRLMEHFGPQNWWPGETPFEVMVGAILTQNTNWGNVEKAIQRIKDAGMLSLEKLVELPSGLLAEYIRPAGYYNVKAARLLNLCHCIVNHGDGTVAGFLAQPLAPLRNQLLGVKGVGQETADCILLYAAQLPIFVVDTYTYRVLSRHDLVGEPSSYNEMQELFMDNLDIDVDVFNEYHALLVQVGKQYCRKKNPACTSCPLNGI